jgi:hypothetical protein
LQEVSNHSAYRLDTSHGWFGFICCTSSCNSLNDATDQQPTGVEQLTNLLIS